MAETRVMPRQMDINRPCAARIFDAFLGGGHNFGVERSFVDELAGALPGITDCYRANRAFVRRTVEHMVSLGIRQFLDLGSGIPSIGPVHEVVRRKTEDYRVLYVDNEPLTVSHSGPLLACEPHATITCADLREPDSILRAPETTALLDLSRPVGLLMSAVLHFLPHDPRELTETYMDALSPGSCMVVSHLTDSVDPHSTRTLQDFYARTADPLFPRSIEWIDSLFGDWEVRRPGTTLLPEWRPEPGERVTHSRYHLLYGGLAVKR